MNKTQWLAYKGELAQYLLAKAYQEDWHGVADAAMDLREVEVEIKHAAL